MLTKTQRKVLEEMLRKIERGPLNGWGESGNRIDEYTCKIWTDSWMGDPIRAILDNDDGKLPNRELEVHVG